MKPLALSFLLFLFSCTAQQNSLLSNKHTPVDMELYNNEIVKYGMKEKDTLLDIGSNSVR
jgi:hypothetical protein